MCVIPSKRCTQDLIDTQWNVNITYAKIFDELKAGFNRYIVECKFTEKGVETAVEDRFNRYIVECKYSNNFWYCKVDKDLIDTQWNVNVFLIYQCP